MPLDMEIKLRMSRFGAVAAGIYVAIAAVHGASAQGAPVIELPTTAPNSKFAPDVTPPQTPTNDAIPSTPPAGPARAYAEPEENPTQIPSDNNLDKELAYRVSLGRAADVKLLIEKGASPNSLAKGGVPLLFIAVNRNDPEALDIVAALLDGGTNINTKDTNGQTALYEAARNGNAEMVQYLLDRGIDYYSLDNFGDIARTLAFRAGHDKVVKLMDEFVKYQTAQTLKLDADAINLSQSQRDRLAAIERKKIEEEQRKKEEERKRIEAERKAAEEKRIAEERAAEEERQRVYQENLKRADEKIYQIAYNACAFQYWSYCRDARQTIELSKDELKETIERHRLAVETGALEIMNMFETNQQYVNNIINPSKQYIFDELDAMPSRTYRKEDGVGKIEDMNERCSDIADLWQVHKPRR